jgi:hypothetical protein
MKFNATLFATLLFSVSAVFPVWAESLLHADPLIKPNDVVAICGDSITQQERYSVFIEDYLLMCQPAPNVHAVQFGIDGASAYALEKQSSVLMLFHPTVATMLYGMNDGHFKPLDAERTLAYRLGMNGSIEALKRLGVREVVVASPTFNWYMTAPYNNTLASLGDLARDIAQAHEVQFTDLHAIMKEAVGKVFAAAGPHEKVPYFDTHPEPCGHLIIAYAFLKGLGFDGAIGTITVDLGQGTATGSEGQNILSVHDGKVEIESTRYPFCFQGDPEKRGPETANILKYLPFNEELNRYLLVVHGMKSARAKVSWGEQRRVIAAAELENGVNLAALFVPDNPFSAQFAKVETAVRDKQEVEKILTSVYLTQLWQLRKAIPSQDGLLEQLTKAGLENVNWLTRAEMDLVIPIRHTITIEPE